MAEPIKVTAYVGPTGFGTYGIRWRGDSRIAKDYSGPYNTEADAADAARSIADAYGWGLTVEQTPNVNGPQWRGALALPNEEEGT